MVTDHEWSASVLAFRMVWSMSAICCLVAPSIFTRSQTPMNTSTSAATSGQTHNWVRRNHRVSIRTLATLDVREWDALDLLIMVAEWPCKCQPNRH